MAEDKIKPGKAMSKPTLIQTKLPAAFFTQSKSVPHPSATSPYFSSSSSAPPLPTSTSPAIKYPDLASETPKLSLYPERRAHLPREPPPLPSSTSSTLLSLTASETKSLLPALLSSAWHAPATGHLYHTINLAPLASFECPSLRSTRVHVVNADSLDTAIALSPQPAASASSSKPVLILNMANAQHGGGGWLKGAMAQEEALCYRSSLSFTLKRRYYPIPDFGGIYSPSVLVVRQSLAIGHDLLNLSRPADLPVVSVVSVAAVREPEVIGGQGEMGRYKHAKVRAVMKEKLRVVLRIAARMGHRSLVLGALGCGAFGNPRGEVVLCWKEVLREIEFAGGWWERVVFAVMEGGGTRDGPGNYGVFWRELDGLEI